MNDYIIKTNFAYIVIDSPKHGNFMAKIDLDDIEKCKQYNWGINKCRKIPYVYKNYVYANYKKQHILLHRFIINASPEEYVDHINRDTLDNRRENLQICGLSANGMNGDTPINNTSGHKGVSWCGKLKTPKYKAYIMIEYKYCHLGYFDNYEEAIKAREIAEVEYFTLKNKKRKEDTKTR